MNVDSFYLKINVKKTPIRRKEKYSLSLVGGNHETVLVGEKLHNYSYVYDLAHSISDKTGWPVQYPKTGETLFRSPR